MNVENFAEWMRRQGHPVYRTESSFWHKAGPRTLQAFPYFWLVEPSKAELRKLMLTKGILSLRYSTPIDAPEGKVSYHIDVRNPYTLDMLKSQARNGVKKGQVRFQVQQVPFARLADEGWLLQQDTLERQCRLGCMRSDTWSRMCMAADGLPGFEAWAAIADGVMAGALLTARIDDVVCVPYALSRSQFLKDHVNNVLFFQTITNLLCRPGVNRVFLTVQSLDAPESVDEFKFRMSFNAMPVRQRVVLSPLAAPLSTPLGVMALNMMLKRYPGSNLVAKTEGMVRFYLQGRQSLQQQQWPDCVAQYNQRTAPSTAAVGHEEGKLQVNQETLAGRGD